MQTLIHLIGILVIVCVGVICNIYVARRIIHPLYKDRGARGYLAVHYSLVAILATLAVIASLGGLHNFIATLVWVMYGFMLTYIPKLTYVLVACTDHIGPKGRKTGHYTGLVLAAISAVIILYSTFNRYNIEVTNTTIASQRLPKSFDNYRIVQISDLHLETLFSHRYAQKVANQINALEPDLILFTGDLVNRKAEEILPYKDALGSLKARDGIYSVMGNHDYGEFVKWPSEEAKQANLLRLESLQAEMGWQLLNNEHLFIHRGNDSIAIIGVENWGEPPFQQYGDLSKAYPALYDDTYKILLSHNSRHWRSVVLPQSNIDLTLSGHTHALQFSIAGISPAALQYPEWGGLYEEGNRALYVNIGLGCTMVPTRLGANPEITVITLKHSAP